MKKVLIIENDSDTLDLLGYIIADMNFHVQRMSKLISLKEIQNINPDIILIDYWLPNGKGSDACLEIKNNESTAHIPVILMSTNIQTPKIAEDCLADTYIEKPFDIDDLIKVLMKFAK